MINVYIRIGTAVYNCRADLSLSLVFTFLSFEARLIINPVADKEDGQASEANH